MITETLNGLLTQKPGRDPQQGEVKLFTIEHRKGKSGKPYIKVKNATAEQGGQPYRVLSAEKTDFVDQHGNISFSVEIEASSSAPTAFANARATMQQGEPGTAEHQAKVDAMYERDIQQGTPNAPQSPPARSNGGDGVTEARKHLMQSANLYNLCVAAVDKAIAPNMPPVAQTSEMFQAAVASLYIEASRDQWWSGKIVRESWIASMPTTPLVPNGKHSTTARPFNPNLCTCENTDGDNPLCPIHSE